ncbi:hypothetical protein BGZ72_007068 [Mortierella alpina]|nr:hypothetical protein BGZ72_007068 [Mortierella alpina]
MKYLIALSALLASATAWQVTIYQHGEFSVDGWSKTYSNTWNVNQKILLPAQYNDRTSSFVFIGDRNGLRQKVNSITFYKHYDANGNCSGQMGYSCGSWTVNQISPANNDQLSCIQVKYHLTGC